MSDRSASDIISEVREEMEALERQVTIVDDFIVLNVSSEYSIPISECDSAEKLLGWISHLTEKTWMTMPVMARFISVAARASNIQIVY